MNKCQFTWKQVFYDENADVPDGWGLYAIHDGAGEIIYVGRSVDPMRRLQEHFNEWADMGDYLRRYMPDSLSWIVTIYDAPGEKEGALIREHLPYFNSHLKLKSSGYHPVPKVIEYVRVGITDDLLD